MRKPILPLFASGLILGLAVMACSSESTSANPTTSTSSTSTSSGAGGNGAGGGEGGEAGNGGSCSGGAGEGDPCIDCVLDLESGDCEEVFSTCRGIPSCDGWLDCIEVCAHQDNSSSCYQDCDQQFLGSNSANQNLKSCACFNCTTECGALCPCGI